MGGALSSCCNQEVTFDKPIQLEEVRIDMPIKLRALRRHDKPDPYFFKPLSNAQQFESMINRYKANERRLKKTLKVNIAAVEQNRLQEPYFIVNKQAFYIGEWAYNKLFHSDVPSGIGRLYQQEYISEGEFEVEPVVAADESQLENESTLDQEKKRQLAEQLAVSLHGRGRKFNQQELIEGDFVHGKLEGTGLYENREKGREYTYEGTWVKGKRKGRGVETTKQYIYNGEFDNDRRQGKGIYTHILNPTLKHELQLEDKRVQERLKQLEMRDQSEKEHKDNIKTQRKELIELFNKVLQKHYSWVNPFEGTSLLDNPDFYRERLIRTAYAQTYNGDFHEDRFHGYGMYVWNAGKAYRGDWQQGKLHGIGEFLWPNNIIYRGRFQNDKKHGKGQIIWSEGLRWRGLWAYGMRHGYGEGIQINFEQKTMRVIGSKWRSDKEVEVCFREKWGIVDFQPVKMRDRQEDDSEQQIGASVLKATLFEALTKTLVAQRQQKLQQELQKKTVRPTRKMQLEQASSTYDMKTNRMFNPMQLTPRTKKSTGAGWMRVNFFDT